ncbi:hypothetical protein FH972_024017 [Carpinus fangiana]|uniref:Phosphoribosylaminoimidazole-succinocarboxamide synthase n=1 Tax=Carpinus fangiana TaxID=176857 RepID=A0A5N6KWT4_9ROSI|nr:hypothetical protein FH972_024017 [Carpinus fangiana]
MSSDYDSVSPGTDDTPYIRFAIDQLTRDEEVRGSRAYPHPSTGAEYSADRKIYDEGLGYSASQRTQKATFVAPTADRASTGLLPTATRSSHIPSADANLGEPATSQFLASSQTDILVPFDQDVPPLRFLPSILRPLWLAIFLFLLLWALIGLLAAGIWSSTHLGFEHYTQLGGSRYFVYQYLPTFLGTLLFLWLLQIQIAVQRVAPFIAMASMSSRSRAEGPLMTMLPTNFLIPNLSYFRAGMPVLGSCMVVFWLQIFTLPLLTCLFNVFYFGSPQTGSWRWLAVQGVCWTVFVLYVLLFVAVLTLCVWLKLQRTGLKWDPRSLADTIALLDRSNITRDYANTEVFHDAKDFRARLAARSDRIGYWHTSRKPNETFYTIGEEGADIRRYTLERGSIQEKPSPVDHSSFPDTPTTPGAGLAGDLESGVDLDAARWRHLPWYLKPSMVLLWSIIAIVLYLAFLIVSFVNRAVVHGFNPLTNVEPSSAGFSATNFTFSFIPALIAQFLFLAWLSVDYSLRRTQPFANMASNDGNGAPAERSLLLDYPARLPVSVTVTAVLCADYHVAWFSFMTLITACLPMLAGGCFWAQFYVSTQTVRVAVETSGYYALCVFLAFYAFSLPFLFVGLHSRKLPHAATTLAENVSFLYQSRLLGEREWRAPLGSKTELVTRLVTATTARERELNSGEGRFVFGRCIGRDGKTHIGIDRVGREGARSMGDTLTSRHSSGSTSDLTPQRPRAAHTLLAKPSVGTPFHEKVRSSFHGEDRREQYL